MDGMWRKAGIRLGETGAHRKEGGPYTFLRNEPTVLRCRFSYIVFICRTLRRLQKVFAGGFVLENEPKIGGSGVGFGTAEHTFCPTWLGKRTHFWGVAAVTPLPRSRARWIRGETRPLQRARRLFNAESRNGFEPGPGRGAVGHPGMAVVLESLEREWYTTEFKVDLNQGVVR